MHNEQAMLMGHQLSSAIAHVQAATKGRLPGAKNNVQLPLQYCGAQCDCLPSGGQHWAYLCSRNVIHVL